MARTKKAKADKCKWREDEDGNWHTDCDEIFCMTEGTPKENTYRFCPACGNRLAEVKFQEVGAR